MLGGLALSAPAAADYVYRGLARDVETGQPLYRESHYVSAPDSPRQVRIVHYQCVTGGAVFARKELDYAAARETPRFTLTDALWSYSEGLRQLPGGRLQVFQVPGANRAERNALLPAGKFIVADAGFDGDQVCVSGAEPPALDRFQGGQGSRRNHRGRAGIGGSPETFGASWLGAALHRSQLSQVRSCLAALQGPDEPA
jgi:hypothetical protein